MKLKYTNPANVNLSEILPFESIVGNLDIDHLPMIPNAGNVSVVEA